MRKGLEFQFCTKWDSWDEHDTFALQFNDVHLRPEVAEVVGRHFVDHMVVSGEDSSVTFWSWDDFEVTLQFKAELVLTGE